MLPAAVAVTVGRGRAACAWGVTGRTGAVALAWVVVAVTVPLAWGVAAGGAGTVGVLLEDWEGAVMVGVEVAVAGVGVAGVGVAGVVVAEVVVAGRAVVVKVAMVALDQAACVHRWHPACPGLNVCIPLPQCAHAACPHAWTCACVAKSPSLGA